MSAPLTHEAIMLLLQDVGFTVHEDYDGSLFDGDDETLHLWHEDGHIYDEPFITFVRAIEAAHGIDLEPASDRYKNVSESIDFLAEDFFEWDTDRRDFVTFTSAKLFAELCVKTLSTVIPETL